MLSSQMSHFKVAKFGGTSMGTASAMQQAANIVTQDPATKLVVVSATSGTTNAIIELFNLSKTKETALLTLRVRELIERHTHIAEALGSDSQCQGALAALYKELEQSLGLSWDVEKESEVLDHTLSIGERLSSLLFSQALKKLNKSVCVFDVRKVLRTDSYFGKAEPMPEIIAELCERILKPVLERFDVVVTQGFLGADENERTTTLGRGGSDYSAALLAEGLSVEELKIWTDVNGIFTMDPRIVPHASRIPDISFAEAAELANFGAKILHPATLWPAIRKNIRVFVGSTFDEEGEGTRIHSSLEERPLIRAIAVRKNQTLLTVTSLRMLNAHGFLARIFSILAKYQVSVDLVTTSEVSVALTIDSGSLGSSGKKIDEKNDFLQELRQVADVSLEEGLSLIALVGNHLSQSPGVSARAFGVVSEFNIRLICHGASSHNLCFLVKSEEAIAIVRRLHDVFISWSEVSIDPVTQFSIPITKELARV